jgi:hypothetical protein
MTYLTLNQYLDGKRKLVPLCQKIQNNDEIIKKTENKVNEWNFPIPKEAWRKK